MNLYLVQHADAMSREQDPSRGLSARGIDDARRVSAYLQKLHISVHQIFHSGKLRALQTADIIADHIETVKGIVETDGLAPMDAPGIWAARLAESVSDTMLVGHLPHLGNLSGLLVCGDQVKKAVGFETGCVICLRRSEEGVWSIEWAVKPGMLP